VPHILFVGSVPLASALGIHTRGSFELLLDTVVLNSNIIGIFMWNADDRIIDANEAFLRISVI
jgi:PAS domain-containing protein